MGIVSEKIFFNFVTAVGRLSSNSYKLTALLLLLALQTCTNQCSEIRDYFDLDIPNDIFSDWLLDWFFNSSRQHKKVNLCLFARAGNWRELF